VDVADPVALEAYKPAFERLNVLVLSQGTVLYRREEFDREGWDKVMAVNLDSVMGCATKFKSMLTESGGSLIIVSSISGYRSNRGNPAYATSKAGVINLTRTLGEAWAPDGVRVNGIAPGLVDTKLTKVTTGNPKRMAETLARIPLGRAGQPSEMGGVALFLASPLASYVVGQTIPVCGGISVT
jgi:3-oxoacyl-[acyl-carrier protein] reductase